MSTVPRRTKWHPTPPPPPSPKILHFPRSRRTRRKQLKSITTTHNHHRRTNTLLLMHHQYLSNKGKLESLFDQENDELPKSNEPSLVLLNSNSKTSAFERRERVDEEEEEKEKKEGREISRGGGENGFEEEKWRFQAEILRAECNFLRMEREFALRKLERNRVKMERALRSAVQTLVAGRKKIFEGKNVNIVLEEEIEDLAEKLEQLQRSSRIKDYQVRSCSNFDKKACLLQRRLEKLGGLSHQTSSLKQLEKCTESNLSVIIMNSEIDQETSISNCKTKNKAIDNLQVDELKKKMEGLAKGMTDRVGEYCGSILSTANSSVASSASTSKRIDQFPELSALSSRQFYQEPALNEVNKCSGRCKAIVRKIFEQVRAETEQWSQMQEMLGQVRGEMEELQASRDFWENRAHNSDIEIQSLRHAVEEWKEKALGYEAKANELQLELSALKEELQKPKADTNSNHFDERRDKVKSYRDGLNIEEIKPRSPTKDFQPISLGKQLAKEKKMLLHRLKENRYNKQEAVSAEGRRKPRSNSGSRRSPLKDIGNSTTVYAFHSPDESSRSRESFRK